MRKPYKEIHGVMLGLEFDKGKPSVIQVSDENKALHIVTAPDHKPRCPYCSSSKCFRSFYIEGLGHYVYTSGLDFTHKTKLDVFYLCKCRSKNRFFFKLKKNILETAVEGFTCAHCTSSDVFVERSYLVVASKDNKYIIYHDESNKPRKCAYLKEILLRCNHCSHVSDLLIPGPVAENSSDSNGHPDIWKKLEERLDKMNVTFVVKEVVGTR